jgi:hypothetical protein
MIVIVVSGSDEAIRMKIEELAREHYERVKWSFGDKESYKEYRNRVYWHIHEIKAIRL